MKEIAASPATWYSYAMLAMAPNIVVVLTDDHAQWALGCYGNSEIRSPNMDRLAQTGVRMANAFTPLPVCSPARASFFTGRFPSQHGIHDYLGKAQDDMDWLQDEITLPMILSRSGYQTGFSGKWHCGGGRNKPQPGFDFWANRDSGDNLSRDEKGRHVMDQALEFIRKRDKERPFFLFISDTATHSPWRGHREDLVTACEKCSFRDIPEGEKYPFGSLSGENHEEARAHRRENLAQYYAAVMELDEQLGRLIHELDSQGIRNQTLVVYTSDHGLNCSQHGIWGKGNGTRPLNMVEESIRIPLILNQPGVVKDGVVRTEFVDHCDLFQTLLDHVGASIPREMAEPRRYPGHSFRTMLSDGRVDGWKQEQFGEYGYLRMIRTNRYKLVKRALGRPSELFDLEKDPREMTNLFHDPRHQEIVADLSRRIDAFFAKHEDPVKNGLRVLDLPSHNGKEAWRDEQP